MLPTTFTNLACIPSPHPGRNQQRYLSTVEAKDKAMDRGTALHPGLVSVRIDPYTSIPGPRHSLYGYPSVECLGGRRIRPRIRRKSCPFRNACQLQLDHAPTAAIALSVPSLHDSRCHAATAASAIQYFAVPGDYCKT